jgi:hypothetical protein
MPSWESCHKAPGRGLARFRLNFPPKQGSVAVAKDGDTSRLKVRAMLTPSIIRVNGTSVRREYAALRIAAATGQRVVGLQGGMHDGIALVEQGLDLATGRVTVDFGINEQVSR